MNKTTQSILSNIITPNKKRKILYVPPNFITSERYYHARTSMASGDIDIRGMTLKNWFLEKENVKWITKQLFLLYLKNDYKYQVKHGVQLDWNFFLKKVPKWMDEYATDTNIYRYVEDPVAIYTSDLSQLYKYYIEALSKMNREFYKKYYYVVKKVDEYELPGLTGKPDWNPYRARMTVGTKDEFQNNMSRKSYMDMLYYPEQWNQIDVWQDQDIIRANSNFRYNNEIPIWQDLNRARVGLDRDNEGLHDGNPDRASLNNQIHGYLMEDIYKYTTVAEYAKKNPLTGSYT